jgi:K+/H+ antiporter YhaU regulatory subunit KhtT
MAVNWNRPTSRSAPAALLNIGKKLLETDLRDRGVMVIGIRRTSGERLMSPPGPAVIELGDSLFVFGRSQSVNRIIGEFET